MLKLSHVKKTFNKGTVTEKRALTGVDLTLNDGDFVTVIGGNGAGKSTLLNMIAGVYPLDAGTIELDGTDVSRMTDEQYAAFELDWAQSVLAWCRRNLDGITYLPVQTVEISVTQDGDGLWSIDADSMQAFDEAVLYYPAYEGVLTAA